ncbi:hypothetical protein NADE_000904 [Nannochloris sp. 'desiccata']|nr:hypothetical protein NADE_000904 [Chlorella desiccata (nom. nud.)]
MLLTSAPLVGVAPKPTTDPLKQATDRILKEQQVALQNAAMYKSKLDEMATYSSRLEKAYQALVKNNSGLRAKVASDYSLVKDFSTRFDAQNDVLASHEKHFTSLAGELALGELTLFLKRSESFFIYSALFLLSAVKSQREELAKSRADVESVAKRLSKDLSKTNTEVQTLRIHLSEASQKCTAFEAQLKTSSEELAAHKASAEQHASLLSSSLEETKAELSAAKSTFAEQEEAFRLQLSTATAAAADFSSQLEDKLAVVQRLEEELRSVDVLSVNLNEKSALAATLQSSLGEATKAAATAVGRVAELEGQLASEKQRYEQLSQQSDTDRTAAALALEEAAKKFSSELSEALKTAKSESEKELGAERERMSTEIARIQAEHNAELDSLTTDLATATKQTAANEKEKARLENLLDERNLLISQLEQKCSERAAEITKLQQDLNVAAHEAMSSAEKAAKLQQELDETTEELEEKRVALESISAFAGKQNNLSSAVPTAPASAVKKRRATASPPPAHNPRMKHKARFNENPISRTLILEDQDEQHPEQTYDIEPQEDDAWGFNDDEDEEDEEEEAEEVDEEALRTAIVIHTDTTNQAAGGRPMRQARMRQSHVIVEEVDDSDEESYEVPPRALHRNKAPAVKPAKPCIKPTNAGGGSRPAPKSRLAAMRSANAFKPSNAARRGGGGGSKAAKIVATKNRGVGSGCFGSQQHTNQNHTLFNLFGGLGNASPGDT